jgi:hypothetical protein
VAARHELTQVPLEDERWRRDGVLALLDGVELRDGTVELELCTGSERGFYGVVWRAAGGSYESFFVRPHQVGNPDAIQYTPAWNGVSSWQLYHGPGFWNSVEFPLDEWFRIRVAFTADRAEMYVGDLEEPALAAWLRLPPAPGRIGIMAGGEGVRLGAFAYDDAPLELGAAPPHTPPAVAGALRRWEVSEPFAEASLDLALLDRTSWTALEAEPSGLLDLARAHGLDAGDTVFARTHVHADDACVRRLDFGFSDRVALYLNRRPLYRGDDTYRSRDYRFLGSIGWWDSVYLTLERGDNELLFAVSEDFGGWGVQARVDYA